MAQIPVLPFLIHHIGAEASAYGVLQTVFSAVQAIGGLVSGLHLQPCIMLQICVRHQHLTWVSTRMSKNKARKLLQLQQRDYSSFM